MRIDHIAYPCRDPFVTHRFYSEVMGLELVQAYAGRELLLVYALPEGGNMVFSASPGSAPPAERDVAWDRQHVGLTVATRAELEQWMQKLKTHNLEYQLNDDERIYFADPDGLVLELEIAEHVTRNLRALEVLAQWGEANR